MDIDVEIGEPARAVHARIRDAHRDCDPDFCTLRKIWVEDVQTVLDVHQSWLDELARAPRSS